MAKSTKSAKPATPAATTAKAPSRTRGRAYGEGDAITIVEGEGARRVVRNLACDRALQAMKAQPVVGKFIATFGPVCEKQPLPGRAGQPGATQAAAILRYLEREGAVVVKGK